MSLSDYSVDPEVLRLAMRRWTTGVTVVTTVLDGVHHGMTVSSFTSVSLEPPLVLVSIEHITRTCGMLQKSGIFGVTILEAGQQDISDRFAGRIGDHEDRFNGLETFTLATGVSFLANGLACFDCQVVSSIEQATHTLFIGKVVAVQVDQENNPLVYYNRAYRQIQD